jgi:uncharacterized membrane protein (UPF0127 family)
MLPTFPRTRSAPARLGALACALALASAVIAQTLPGGRPLEDLAKFPQTTLEIRTGGHKETFNIWVADTPPREEQGLMFVRDLPPDEGMIFIEREPRVASMWMKNTYIELDMVFIRSDGRVAAVFPRTVPFSETTITAGEPVKAVLEIRGGEAARRGIKVGDLVFSPALAAKPEPARAGS